jgi:hypothetical protein
MAKRNDVAQWLDENIQIYRALVGLSLVSLGAFAVYKFRQTTPFRRFTDANAIPRAYFGSRHVLRGVVSTIDREGVIYFRHRPPLLPVREQQKVLACRPFGLTLPKNAVDAIRGDVEGAAIKLQLFELESKHGLPVLVGDLHLKPKSAWRFRDVAVDWVQAGLATVNTHDLNSLDPNRPHALAYCVRLNTLLDHRPRPFRSWLSRLLSFFRFKDS